jgi:hypothetical protein
MEVFYKVTAFFFFRTGKVLYLAGKKGTWLSFATLSNAVVLTQLGKDWSSEMAKHDVWGVLSVFLYNIR